MLDFRKALKPRQGPGTKRYRPLLMLILLLGIVAMVNDSLRQQGVLTMLDRMAGGSDEPMPKTIDTRLNAVRPASGMPDSFVMAGMSEERPTDELTDELTDDAGGYFPGVSSAELRAIRDDRPSLGAEQPCALDLLNILNKADEPSLSKASMGAVTYAQLFRQPNDYRGRLVNLSGTVRRVERINLPTNPYGIKQYNQVWLFPRDNPSAPVVVYCLSLPEDFPMGDGLDAQVSLTGFFFKRWAYATAEADRVAPMLLAKTLRWWKEPEAMPEPPTDPRWLPMVITFGALAAMFMAWYVSLWARSPRITPDGPPDFTQLRLDGETPPPSDAVEERKEP